MASPSLRVRIDRQGRVVVPQHLRDELVDVPGELLIERTPEGLLLRPVGGRSEVQIASDGLPVLHLDHTVSNDDVLAGIDRERAER